MKPTAMKTPALVLGSLFFLAGQVTCPAEDLLEISATVADHLTIFNIQNLSGKTLLLADPEHAGTVVTYSFPGLTKPGAWMVDADSLVSKHLILLAPRQEDMPHRWSHDFAIRYGSSQPIDKLTIRLWVTTAEDLAKDPQAALKPREFPVKVVKVAPKGNESLNPEQFREYRKVMEELEKADRAAKPPTKETGGAGDGY